MIDPKYKRIFTQPILDNTKHSTGLQPPLSMTNIALVPNPLSAWQTQHWSPTPSQHDKHSTGLQPPLSMTNTAHRTVWQQQKTPTTNTRLSGHRRRQGLRPTLVHLYLLPTPFLRFILSPVISDFGKWLRLDATRHAFTQTKRQTLRLFYRKTVRGANSWPRG